MANTRYGRPGIKNGTTKKPRDTSMQKPLSATTAASKRSSQTGHPEVSLNRLMKALCHILLLLNSIGMAIATTVESHCLDDEFVYFSCRINGSVKIVSLCGGGTHDYEPSWAQYHFGTIGSPELVYPRTRKGSLKQFAGFFESHKAIPFQMQEVWFRIGKYRYKIQSVFSGLTDGDPPCSEEKPCIDNTLTVDDGKRWTYFHCSADATNNLRRLEGYISNDQTDR